MIWTVFGSHKNNLGVAIDKLFWNRLFNNLRMSIFNYLLFLIAYSNRVVWIIFDFNGEIIIIFQNIRCYMTMIQVVFAMHWNRSEASANRCKCVTHHYKIFMHPLRFDWILLVSKYHMIWIDELKLENVVLAVNRP